MSLYRKLEDASSLLFPDGRARVSTFEQYLGWHAAHVEQRGIARCWSQDVRVRAEVNHGRWVAECAACHSGMFTHPEWRLACCAQCGAIYNGVDFPDAARLAEVTRLLLARPRVENQNWKPGEAVWKLRAENVLHGLET